MKVGDLVSYQNHTCGSVLKVENGLALVRMTRGAYRGGTYWLSLGTLKVAYCPLCDIRFKCYTE